MTDTAQHPTGIGAAAARRLWHWSFLGLYFGATWAVFSFTPSLIPRPWLFQGVLAGLVFAAGYVFGVALMWLWAFLELPQVPRRYQIWVKSALVVVAVGRLALYLWDAHSWQNGVRDLMGMPHVDNLHYIRTLLVGGALALALILIARAVILGVSASARLSRNYMKRRVASVVGGAVFLWLLVTLVNGTLISAAITLIDRAQAAVDIADPPGAVPPVVPEKSGSARSLIGWENLGRTGKRFVNEGPHKAEIEAFTGKPALEPIRAYVGLRAGETPRQQAELALAELKRAGAFERSILVIATPTGTGWIDDAAISALEFIHGGDTATVGVQYSYMKSPLSLILEPGRSQDSAKVVFGVLNDYLRDLPDGKKPKVYLFGLSLGSLGSESSPPFYAWVGGDFQGAVWAGPPFRNGIWRSIRAERNAGSTDWLPTFEDGSLIRVLGQDNDLGDAHRGWGPVRIVYVAYPSDAIAFFDENMWWREPDWSKERRGDDVSPLFHWRMFISFFQVGLDMLSAADVPPGHGHNYAPASYVDAWIAVTDPAGWTDDRTTALKALMARRSEPK